MIGRNGNDELNRFLLTVDMVLILLSVIFSRGIGRFLSPIALVLLGFTYYRMFSRDLIRRSDENAKYFRIREHFLGMIRVRKEQWVQRKDYKFFDTAMCKGVSPLIF